MTESGEFPYHLLYEILCKIDRRKTAEEAAAKVEAEAKEQNSHEHRPAKG